MSVCIKVGRVLHVYLDMLKDLITKAVLSERDLYTEY